MYEEEQPVVLVTVEPRTYRTVIGPVIARLRPDLEVRVVEPGEALKEAVRQHASVVVSSLPPPPADERDGTAWVKVVFPAEPSTWVALGDAPLVDWPDFDLEDLLGLVDGLAGTPRTR